MAVSLRAAQHLFQEGSLTQPASIFSFEDFFQGHTRASGWFADRFGKPRRHFCGDFYGHRESNALVLDEKLFYTDGLIESRCWAVNVNDSGVFSAESDSLIGAARGVVHGNTLCMRYTMKTMVEKDKFWELDMRDSMVLQPDGTVHNTNHVYKWGIRIGTVSAIYTKHDGDRLCGSSVSGKSSARPNLFSVR